MSLLLSTPSATSTITIHSCGAAAIGHQLVVSTLPSCRLVKIEQRAKVSLLRSPINGSRLHRVPGAPLLVAEGTKGDLCLWNYETGHILAMIDARESESRCNVSGDPMAVYLLFTSWGGPHVSSRAFHCFSAPPSPTHSHIGRLGQGYWADYGRRDARHTAGDEIPNSSMEVCPHGSVSPFTTSSLAYTLSQGLQMGVLFHPHCGTRYLALGVQENSKVGHCLACSCIVFISTGVAARRRRAKVQLDPPLRTGRRKCSAH